MLQPGASRLVPEPRGVVLILAPWNYPFLLTMEPLVGALTAGNCAVLKPSELAPHTAQVVEEIVAEVFDPAHVTVVQGGPDVGAELVEQDFDYIFFTGGAVRGAQVMEAAGRNLVPCTIELGGKSPCVVAGDAPLDRTARHILWGKGVNAGQTCIAPDYILVHRSVERAFLDRLAGVLEQFYGGDPKGSPDFGRIINDRHYQRVLSLMDSGRVFYGGDHEPDDLYIAPTLLTDVPPDSPIMQEEIFGPLLPVLPYDTEEEALEMISSCGDPVAVYIFSHNRALQRRLVRGTRSGGVCINSTMIQALNHHVPFGGVGRSGSGSYHGRASFDTFTHFRPIMRRPWTVPLPVVYPPYRQKARLLRRLVP